MKHRYHLRLPFWIYCGLTLLVALAGMNRGDNLLFWAFGVMASALLLSGFVSGVMMRGLNVRRISPPHGVVGEPLTVRYAVTNRNRVFPVLNIHIQEREVSDRGGWQRLMRPAPAWVMHLGGRETVHGEAMFWPTRRGPARFEELRLWSTFPFGIIRKSLALSQPQHTLVHPRLYPLRRRVLEAISPAGVIGSRISPHAGAGDDYFGLREYRPGDPLRHIAWKRTANRDELVCIERTRPNPPKLRVVLNLTQPPAASAESAGDEGPEEDLEEQAISLAASIIHGADLAGYEIGLTVLGVKRPPIPIRRSRWHRNRIMAALAEIDLDAPRVPTGQWASAHQEMAGVVVVHPDRPEPAVIRDEAWHFTARQMDHLVDRSEHRPPRAADAQPEISPDTARARESEAAA